MQRADSHEPSPRATLPPPRSEAGAKEVSPTHGVHGLLLPDASAAVSLSSTLITPVVEEREREQEEGVDGLSPRGALNALS